MSKTRHAIFEFPWGNFCQPARRARTPQWLNTVRAVSSHLLTYFPSLWSFKWAWHKAQEKMIMMMILNSPKLLLEVKFFNFWLVSFKGGNWVWEVWSMSPPPLRSSEQAVSGQLLIFTILAPDPLNKIFASSLSPSGGLWGTSSTVGLTAAVVLWFFSSLGTAAGSVSYLANEGSVKWVPSLQSPNWKDFLITAFDVLVEV